LEIGKSASPGTKKTGNHLAKRLAPGERASNTVAAVLGLARSNRHKDANSKMQAPS
jgi:hypothetical protein